MIAPPDDEDEEADVDPAAPEDALGDTVPLAMFKKQVRANKDLRLRLHLANIKAEHGEAIYEVIAPFAKVVPVSRLEGWAQQIADFVAEHNHVPRQD